MGAIVGLLKLLQLWFNFNMGSIWKRLFLDFMVLSTMCLACVNKMIVECWNECEYICIKEISCLDNLPIFKC